MRSTYEQNTYYRCRDRKLERYDIKSIPVLSNPTKEEKEKQENDLYKLKQELHGLSKKSEGKKSS